MLIQFLDTAYDANQPAGSATVALKLVNDPDSKPLAVSVPSSGVRTSSRSPIHRQAQSAGTLQAASQSQPDMHAVQSPAAQTQMISPHLTKALFTNSTAITGKKRTMLLAHRRLRPLPAMTARLPVRILL